MPKPRKEFRPATSKKALESIRLAAEKAHPTLDPSSPQYAAFVEFAKSMYSYLGESRFELNFGLRTPRGKVEEIRQAHFQGRMSDDEMRGQLKAYAERPADLEMLTTFTQMYEDLLDHYSSILRNVTQNPRLDREQRAAKEKAVDRHVAVLRGKYPMMSENMLTALNFLEEVRVQNNRGLVELGDFEAGSAHWLAQLVIERATAAWRSCRAIARRSQTDPRYLYKAEAGILFFETWSSKLPAPQRILERMREEFVLAKLELRRGIESQAVSVGKSSRPTPQEAADEHELDDESRANILVGEFMATVFQSGHIFRPVFPADHGIDGEIEFKDRQMRASGRRVYVQLKSGDSHLRLRKRDNCEIFTVKNPRHLSYWQAQAYPMMLVVRQSTGLIRWMEVSAHLKDHPTEALIVFRGEDVTVASIRALGERMLDAME